MTIKIAAQSLLLLSAALFSACFYIDSVWSTATHVHRPAPSSIIMDNRVATERCADCPAFRYNSRLSGATLVGWCETTPFDSSLAELTTRAELTAHAELTTRAEQRHSRLAAAELPRPSLALSSNDDGILTWVRHHPRQD
jgi:hypothetical protein